MKDDDGTAMGRELVPEPPTPEHLLGLSLLPGGQRFADYFRDEAARRQEQVIDLMRNAVEGLGDTLEEILDRLENDPPRRRLFNETLRAAYASEHGEKLRWLGYLLTSGLLLQDDAQVDEIARVVQTVARLDPADVRLLYLINSPLSPEMQQRDDADAYVARDELAERYPGAANVLDSILAALQREGLIFDKGISSGNRQDLWWPTPFGTLVLATLHQAGLAELYARMPQGEA